MSSKHVFRTSSKHVFKMSSRHIFKTSSRNVLKTSWRRLQRNNFSSFKTSCKTSFKMSSSRLQRRITKNRYAEDVLRTSSRHVFKTSSRRLQDQQMFIGTLVSISMFFASRLIAFSKTCWRLFASFYNVFFQELFCSVTL